MNCRHTWPGISEFGPGLGAAERHRSFVGHGRRIDVADPGLDALGRDGVSVSEAAFIVGYTSTCKFATAFKQTCRITPKESERESDATCAIR